ncbi:MAG: hypothetical protein U5N85_23275 [Arcicella sp.]|nr:hypothetical protein [Arcicella sp.]
MKQTLMKIIIFQLLSFFAFNSYAQNLTWDYPIKPGTEKWKSYQNTPDIVRDLQMPEKLLKSINTKELLEICLKYPFLRNYTASDSPYQGMNGVINSFNGFKELTERKDISINMIEYYKTKRISEIEVIDSKGGFTFDYCAFELLLCSDNIMSKFSNEERIFLLKLLMKKLNEKAGYDMYFGDFGKMTSAFVANKFAIVLGKKETKSDDKMQSSKNLFADKMIMSDLKVVDLILSDVTTFVQTLK